MCPAGSREASQALVTSARACPRGCPQGSPEGSPNPRLRVPIRALHSTLNPRKHWGRCQLARLIIRRAQVRILPGPSGNTLLIGTIHRTKSWFSSASGRLDASVLNFAIASSRASSASFRSCRFLNTCVLRCHRCSLRPPRFLAAPDSRSRHDLHAAYPTELTGVGAPPGLTLLRSYQMSAHDGIRLADDQSAQRSHTVRTCQGVE
jgi:hypothetical protein